MRTSSFLLTLLLVFFFPHVSSESSPARAHVEISVEQIGNLINELEKVEGGASSIAVSTPNAWLSSAEAYISSGAAGRVDAFLAPRPDWNVDESGLRDWTSPPSQQHDSSNQLVFKRSHLPLVSAFAGMWRQYQFGDRSCETVKIVGGGGAPWGSWSSFIVIESRIALKEGATLAPYPNFKSFYLSDKNKLLCGDSPGNVWECLFLPWNNCGLYDTIKRIARDPKSSPAEKAAAQSLQEGSSGGSSMAAYNGSLWLCPSHKKCGIEVPNKREILGGRAEMQPALERLLRYTLTRRFSFRLRRLIDQQKGEFFEAHPSFPRPAPRALQPAAAPASCAFVQIRHGDKMCDGWFHRHKTASHFFDLDRALSEAVALFPAGSALGRKHVLLATDDDDIVRDALSPAIAAAAVDIALAPGSDGKQSTRCLLTCKVAGNKIKNWTEYPGENMQCPEGKQRHNGQFVAGTEELARLFATEEIAKVCDIFVATCQSSFAKALWNNVWAARGRPPSRSFSFSSPCPSDDSTDRALRRTCRMPCANASLCEMVGAGPRECSPPTPMLPNLANLSRWTPILHQIGVI